jgi:hypothetical protein
VVEGVVVPKDEIYTGRFAGSNGCRHEVDLDSLPKWNSKLGKVWVCKLCGADVFKRVPYTPLGKKVHASKKERRRQKALEKELEGK